MTATESTALIAEAKKEGMFRKLTDEGHVWERGFCNPLAAKIAAIAETALADLVKVTEERNDWQRAAAGLSADVTAFGQRAEAAESALSTAPELARRLWEAEEKLARAMAALKASDEALIATEISLKEVAGLLASRNITVDYTAEVRAAITAARSRAEEQKG